MMTVEYPFVYYLLLSGDKYIERFFWQNPFPDSNPGDCIELLYQSGSAKYSWNPESRQDKNALLCQYSKYLYVAHSHEFILIQL